MGGFLLIETAGQSIFFYFIYGNQALTLKGQILILADESLEDSIVHSDSRSLATLLLIRDIQVRKVKITADFFSLLILKY